MPNDRVLDARTLNRTLLARQLLLERVMRPVSEVLEHLVGMQSQVPAAPYVGLWSRIRDFDPAELSRLMEERRAVRMTLMRSTLHLVTARDALALRPVTQPAQEAAFGSSSFRRNLGGLDLDALRAAGIALMEEAPCSTAELGRRLAERWPGRDPVALAYGVRYLVPVVQVTPRGVWGRSGQPRMTTLASWLGRSADGAPDVAGTVRRYLAAFGPATLADLRTWSSRSGLRPVVEQLRSELQTYRDESGRELFDLAQGEIVPADRAAPVRFLPEYDNVLLSHADRSRITAAGYAPRVINRTSRGALLVDGFVAGTWGARRSRDRPELDVELFAPLARADTARVEAEGTRLLAFLAAPGGNPAVRLRAAD